MPYTPVRLLSLAAAISVPLTLLTVPTPASADACTPAGPPATGVQAQQNVHNAVQAGHLTPGAGEDLLAKLGVDASLQVDSCGMSLYLDPIPTAPDPDLTRPGQIDPDDATISDRVIAEAGTDPFTLHSNPGADRVVWLRFTGGTLTGTAWNTTIGSSSVTVSGYDTDSSPSTWSVAEQTTIRSVWARVAEDFSPFNVDVTTEDPGAAALARTDASDTQYGMTAWITPSTTVSGGTCNSSCGGIAYVGVYDYAGANTSYSPAWVFPHLLSWDAKNIAEAASHEIGHTLGLSHDGKGAAGYYTGAAGWAPIMGVGYYQPLSQWSKGEYSGATNTEDDLAIITSHGLPHATDETGSTAAAATTVSFNPDGSFTTTGILTPGDTDAWRVTTAEALDLTVTPNAVSPNADLQLSVSSFSTGAAIATVNPAMAYTARDAITGLDAAVTIPAGDWVVTVSGAGYGDPTGTGYSSYGSIGTYTLTGYSSSNPPPPGSDLGIIPEIAPGTIARPYTGQLTASGGTAPYSWSFVTPYRGWTLTSDGVLTGRPRTASQDFDVVVADAQGAVAYATITLTSDYLPVITTEPRRLQFAVGVNGGGTLVTSKGVAPVALSLTDGALPDGVTFDPQTGELSGVPTVDGTYRLVFSAVDADGRTAIKRLSLRVMPAVSLTTRQDTYTSIAGRRGSVRFSKRGGVGPFTYELIAGTLPEGVIQRSTMLTGTPTVSGTYPLTFQVTDSLGGVDTAEVTWVVAEPDDVTVTLPQTPRTLTVGRTEYVRLAATGGNTPYTWEILDGALPDGMTLTSRGLISGIPTTSGLYDVTIGVTPTRGASGELSLSLTVMDPASAQDEDTPPGPLVMYPTS